jgi:hypothetical protein
MFAPNSRVTFVVDEGCPACAINWFFQDNAIMESYRFINDMLFCSLSDFRLKIYHPGGSLLISMGRAALAFAMRWSSRPLPSLISHW